MNLKRILAVLVMTAIIAGSIAIAFDDCQNHLDQYSRVIESEDPNDIEFDENMDIEETPAE